VRSWCGALGPKGGSGANSLRAGAAVRRALRPKATASLAVVPLTVSDLTAAAMVGLAPRPFREFLRAERVRHARVGRRVVARVEDVLGALDRVANRQADDELVEAANTQPDAGAALLARIGRVRSAESSR
jgi:hypothetical protein